MSTYHYEESNIELARAKLGIGSSQVFALSLCDIKKR